MTAKTTKWVRLGDYIELCDESNSEGKYGVEDVKGISVEKCFIPTKANMEGVSLLPYKIVAPQYFSFVSVTSRNGGKISLAMNDTEQTYIVSSSYEVFHCKAGLLPEYLYLLFNRADFDRYARFNSWGSARETFDWEALCRTQIPLPALSVQRDLVASYKGLQELAESNEALIAPLSEACAALIVDAKRTFPLVPLGEYIEEKDERNTEVKITLSQGISNLKFFQEPKQTAANSQLDKIVRKGQFAYNRATTRNGEKISIAYREGEDCTISSAYGVFQIIDERKLLPEFLMLYFRRAEFDRYARWRSEGSAHEFFTFEMMQELQIPLPPLAVQERIVALYHCIKEAKSIAQEARKQLRTLCPALVQAAVHS